MKKIFLLLLGVTVMTLTGCGTDTGKGSISADGININIKTQGSGTEVKAGDNISVNYIGRTTDGKVFDSSIESEVKAAGLFATGRTYQPLDFQVSGGQMIPGFDKGVIGMKIGETRVIKFGSELAYGPSDPKAIVTTGVRAFVDAGIPTGDIAIGAMFNFGDRPGRITAITDTDVTIDFNSQLAGKDLEFEVTLVSIK